MLQLYKNIKSRRQELGLTQTELALKTGYADKSMIAKIEKGTVDLPQSKIKTFADALETTASDLMGEPMPAGYNNISSVLPGFEQYPIPLVATVAAGIPLYSEDHIIGYVGYSKESDGHIFAVKIKGDSMSPMITDGDTVIVDQDASCEENDICIVTVNGNDGTCKRVRKSAAGLTLISINPNYEPMFYSAEEVETIPVRVVGKVIQVQRNF